MMVTMVSSNGFKNFTLKEAVVLRKFSRLNEDLLGDHPITRRVRKMVETGRIREQDAYVRWGVCDVQRDHDTLL